MLERILYQRHKKQRRNHTIAMAAIIDIKLYTALGYPQAHQLNIVAHKVELAVQLHTLRVLVNHISEHLR